MAAHSKLIQVDQTTGNPPVTKRYLYVMGGVKLQQTQDADHRLKTIVLDTVSRIEINPVNGKVVEGATWESNTTANSWGKMNFGRLEFATLVSGDYLYVIGGDLNVPPEPAGQDVQVRLFYSTIERLNLTRPQEGWKPYAILSGVNFYPEATIVKNGTVDEIHVVGGVYGNPFPPLKPDDPSVVEHYLDDMIDEAGDATKWPIVKDLNVIGSVNPYLTKAGPGGAIATTKVPLGPAVQTPVTNRLQPGQNGYQHSTTTTTATVISQRVTTGATGGSGSGSGNGFSNFVSNLAPVTNVTNTAAEGVQGDQVNIQAAQSTDLITPHEKSILLTDAPVDITWDGFHPNPNALVNLYWRNGNGGIWKTIATRIPFSQKKYTGWELTPTMAGFLNPRGDDNTRIHIMVVAEVNGQLPDYLEGIETKWPGFALNYHELLVRHFELDNPDDVEQSVDMGSNMNIQWWIGASDVAGAYNLWYRTKPSDPWVPINDSPVTYNNGGNSTGWFYSYAWTIPRTPTEGFTAQIKISPAFSDKHIDSYPINTKPFRINNGGFHVTQPNLPYLKWRVGTQQTIAWDKGDLGDRPFQVIIQRPDLNGDGKPDEQWITNNAQFVDIPGTNEKKLVWTVTPPPDGDTNSSEEIANVRIGVRSDYGVISWALYSVTLQPKLAPLPSIFDVSPLQPGEEWEANTSHEITWKAKNFTGSVSVYLCKLTGTDQYDCSTVISNGPIAIDAPTDTPKSYSYTWDMSNVPGDLVGEGYRILVKGIENGAGNEISGRSAYTFDIVAQLNPHFIGIQPSGIGPLYWGRNYHISWQMQDFITPQPVNVYYTFSDGENTNYSPWVKLNSSPVMSGSGSNHYPWTLPAREDRVWGMVRVCLATPNPATDCATSSFTPPTPSNGVQSGRIDPDYHTVFEKYNPPPVAEYIDIIQPIAGDDLTPGTQYDIKWNAYMHQHLTGTTVYDIDYKGADGNWYMITPANGVAGATRNGTPADLNLKYTWTVPAISLDDTQIRIKARPVAGQTAATPEALSGKFSIAGGSDELASQLSNALLDGSFVTTVGEHYIIVPDGTTKGKQKVLANRPKDLFNRQIDELGSDYVGELSDFWKVGTTMRIGHLRFLVTVVKRERTLNQVDLGGGGLFGGNYYGGGYHNQPVWIETTTLGAVPVPQGRYGHKLVKNFLGNNTLVVLGGASWSKELNIQPDKMTNNTKKFESYKTFWVIDDGAHPLSSIPAYQNNSGSGRDTDFLFDYGRTNYKFIGNIAYKWEGDASDWWGTNGTRGTIANGGTAFHRLSNANLAFNNSAPGLRQGRAFFGLAPLELPNDATTSKWVVIGGLQNSAPYETAYGSDYVANTQTAYFRIPVSAVSSAETFNAVKWSPEAEYTFALGESAVPVYNLQAFSINNNKVVAYSGQYEFQKPLKTPLGNYGQSRLGEGAHLDSHVPDYSLAFSRQTIMYQYTNDAFADRWFKMSDMLTPDSQRAEVKTVVINPSRLVLKAGRSASFGVFAYDTNGSKISQDNLICNWSTEGNNKGTIDPDSGVFTANADATPGQRQPVSVSCKTKGGLISKPADDAEVEIQADDDTKDQLVQLVMWDPPFAKLRKGDSRVAELVLRDGLGGEIPADAVVTVAVSGNAGFTVEPVNPDDLTSRFYRVTATETAQSNAQAVRATVTQGERNITRYMEIEISQTAVDVDAVSSFAANAIVKTGGTTEPVIAAYNFGGVRAGVFKDTMQMLGLFGKGAINATVKIDTSPIAPDGYSSATVTIALRNGIDEKIYQNDSGVRYAATIYTSRSADPIVSDDRTFQKPPASGKDDRGERISDPVPGFNNQYVYFDTNGQAAFKIYSKALTNATGIDVIGKVILDGSTNPLLSASAKLVVANIDGVPSILNSTIKAVPKTVPADGTTTSEVTVTLRDWHTNPQVPVTDYYVRLLSDRNTGNEPVDVISGDLKVNGSGEAKFTIKSAKRGTALLRISYAKTAEALDNWPELPDLTETVQFVGLVTLEPNLERQGQTIPEPGLTARGQATDWESGKTTVRWVEPSSLSFADRANNGRVLKADGLTRSSYSVVASTQPNTKVKLTFLEGEGFFWSAATNDVRTLEVTTNGAGVASFLYRHGGNPGLVKIQAEAADGAKREMWLYLVTNRNINPYLIKLVAGSRELGNGETTTVKAGVYDYNGALLEDADISLVTEDGTFSNLTKVNGVTQATYTKGTKTGEIYIFAHSKQGNITLAGALSISTKATGDVGISGADTLVVQSKNTMVMNPVTVSANATVGFWTFVVETDFNNDGEITADETETALFQVVPENYSTTDPILTSINPNNSNRPATSLKLAIAGLNTTFAQGFSNVIFTYAGDDTTTPGGITVKSVEVIDFENLDVTIDVSGTATLGDWNVKVDTNIPGIGHEVAELAGDADFTIGVAHNMGIDILADPFVIARNGWSTSNLTVFVYQYDPISKTKTPLVGKTVNFTLERGTGGSLHQASGTTDSQGFIRGNYYTTDYGTEGAEIYVVGRSMINNIQVTGEAMIVRYVATNNGNLGLSANPTNLDLRLPPNQSTLTAIAKDNAGQTVSGVPVYFLFAGNSGSVNPSFNNTNSSGQATSTFQRKDNLTEPTVATIVAKADIPGVGVVFSAPAEITIGDFTQFNFTFTCGPAGATTCTVPTGGSPLLLTANLKKSNLPQGQWPVSFSISTGGAEGDYLTRTGGETNGNGVLTTNFISGDYAGSLFVTAKALGLPSKSVIITKQANSVVSATRSTITAVPRFVMANGTDTSTVTVIVRNANGSPLSNKTVTLNSNQADTISPDSRVTGIDGKAMFTIKSSTVHESRLRATVDAVSIEPAYVNFVQGGLIAANFDVTVPLQNKAYDRSVAVYLRETTAATPPNPPTIQFGEYKIDANNKLVGLPTIYLYPSRNYAMWVKGPYHLARVRTFISPTTTGQTIQVNFTNNATQTNPGGGLLIGDLATPQSDGGQNGIPIGLHSNIIDILDYSILMDALTNPFGSNSYIADIWPASIGVEMQDFVQLMVNFLNPTNGDTLP
jgi:hypothetical protein